MDRLTLFVGKKWIITIHRGHSNIVNTVHRKIRSHGYFTLAASPSTDVLLYVFMDLVINEYYLFSDLIHERLQKLSKQAGRLFRERSRRVDTSFGPNIAESRDQVLILRQAIGNLREIVGRITRGEFDLIPSNTLPRFEDLYDRAMMLIEAVDTHREEIGDIVDILINVQTLATNNIIRILTIISAIFLPLNLIAGIYGTNFGPGFSLPGSDNSYGFYLMVATMIILALALIMIFRRRGWI